MVVGEDFICSCCTSLTSLEGAPKSVGANVEGQAMIYPYWDKIAILVGKDNVAYFNTGDFEYRGSSSEISKLNLPKYEFKCEFEIPSNWKLNEDGTYDVDGDVKIIEDMIVNGRLPYKFGKVTGDFSCYKCRKLTSLEGAPNSVGGFFDAGRVS